jgi:acetoin utilization protein AcuB
MASKKTPTRKTQIQKRRTSASKGAAKVVRARSDPPTVGQFMTSSVRTIGTDQSLGHAHEMMNKYRIRHLPVLDGGELVGIVSQRDLYFVETFGDTPPAEIRVDEAMTTDVFVTSRDAPLADVVRTMIKRKLGCAVVTRAGNVIGVFSAIDGLKALLQYAPS